jgi:hypothetical protein
VRTVYEPEPHPTLRQGDIVLGPSVVLQAAAGSADPAEPPRVVGEPTESLVWSASDLVPGLAVEASFGPVLVLSHDCELEKEFNERVTTLVADGWTEADAVAEASADPTLDPFVVVAPLLPYDAFDPERRPGIRAGQRIGVLPIDLLPLDGGDYAVDLFRPVTVRVEMLPRSAKVASLARPSVYELRYKLSEAYASRDLSVLAELEALVGHTIVGVEALPKSAKKTSVVLHLDEAESVHLEIRRPRDAVAPEVVRPPRPTTEG